MGYLISLLFDSSEPENFYAGLFSLIILVIFLIITFRKGIAAVAGAFSVTGAVAGAFAIVGAFAVAVSLFGLYIGWRALKGDERDAGVRSFVVAIAATGGTNFQGANLTDTIFTRATLKILSNPFLIL